MKYICLFLLSYLVACQNNNVSMNTDAKGYSFEGLYLNEYGEILIKKKNEELVEVLFKNNAGDEYKTEMGISYDFSLMEPVDSLPFLTWRKGGLFLEKGSVSIMEFSARAFLTDHIRIKEMYTRKFYKEGYELKLKAKLIQNKSLVTVDGFHLKDYRGRDNFVKVQGKVKKEKYPIAYYSTDESPQGVFGSDTSIVHYRLVLEDYTILENYPKEKLVGYTINIDNRAGFIYEFADSAVYLFDKRRPWKEEELNRKIELEAVLLHENGETILKDWKILGPN